MGQSLLKQARVLE